MPGKFASNDYHLTTASYMNPCMLLNEFCSDDILEAQRNWQRGGASTREIAAPPRLLKIMELTDSYGLYYRYTAEDTSHFGRNTAIFTGHNYELFVNAGKEKTLVFLIHHDIVNVNTTNINDNTASVCHGIALYHRLINSLPLLTCNVLIAFCDAEELVDLTKAGSVRVGARLKENGLTNEMLCGVIAPELTACGQHYWFNAYGSQNTALTQHLNDNSFSRVNTPCNDADYVNRACGLDTICLGSFREQDYKEVVIDKNYSCELWRTCHRHNDTLEWVCEPDMLALNDLLYSFAFTLA